MKRIAVLAAVAALVLATAYGAITVYDKTLKVGRMWETPAVRPYQEPIPAMAPGLVPVSGGEAFLRHTGDRDAVYPVSLKDPAVIEAGKKGYFTYCVHCHGKYHDGYGTVGQSFAPLPGNLRSSRVQHLPEGALFREISYGIPGGRQPALATTIEASDRWRIVAYVKSLGVASP